MGSGRQREDGESWYDGCRRCFCYEGHEMCAMITCPVPHCYHPIIKRGECCPTCPNIDQAGTNIVGMTTRCSSGDGSRHVEGEVWRLDECSRCLCHDGGVLCEIETCPPVLCHHPSKLPDTCCLACQDGSSLVALPPSGTRRSCVDDAGAHVSDGDSWRVSACQSCVCRTGQVHCYSQTCHLLTCNKTVMRKGQCCPACTDESIIPVSSCLYEGEEYEEGERWLDGPCSRCVCGTGKAFCTRPACSTPRDRECTHRLHVPGRCCPVCLNATSDSVGSSNNILQISAPTTTQSSDDKLDMVLSRAWRSQRVVVAVLVAMVLLLCAAVILLFLVMIRARRKSAGTQRALQRRLLICSPSRTTRPKSTNVDLQGVSPLPAALDRPYKCRSMGTMDSRLGTAETPVNCLKDVCSVETRATAQELECFIKPDIDTKLGMDDMPQLRLVKSPTYPSFNHANRQSIANADKAVADFVHHIDNTELQTPQEINSYNHDLEKKNSSILLLDSYPSSSNILCSNEMSGYNDMNNMNTALQTDATPLTFDNTDNDDTIDFTTTHSDMPSFESDFNSTNLTFDSDYKSGSSSEIDKTDKPSYADMEESLENNNAYQ